MKQFWRLTVGTCAWSSPIHWGYYQAKIIAGRNFIKSKQSLIMWGLRCVRRLHQDAMVMDLDVAEWCLGLKNLKLWKSRHCLVINDTSQPYELTYSWLRTLIVHCGLWLVLKQVMARIRQDLIERKAGDHGLFFHMAVGRGRLNRFGLNRSRAEPDD